MSVPAVPDQGALVAAARAARERGVAAPARDRRPRDRGRVDLHRDLRAAGSRRTTRSPRARRRSCRPAGATSSAPTSSAATCSRACSTARGSRSRSRSCSSRSRSLIGGTLGAIAGYFGGIVDGFVMRSADLVFAFPAIILAMVVTAALGPTVRNAVLALVIVSWPSYARVVRGLVLSVGEAEYVQSARLLGKSARRTLIRDILPNVFGPVLVLATLDLGNAVLLLSGLSFLGLGAQPPTAGMGRGRRRGHAVLPVLVDRHVPGPRDLHRRARVQLPRRLAARCTRSAVVVVAGRRRRVSALLDVQGLTVTLADEQRADDDRRRRRLRGRAGPGLRRRRRVRQRQDDLGARPDAAPARGRAHRRRRALRRARPAYSALRARCATSAAPSSRWSSRTRSRRCTRCSRSASS